MEKNAQQVEELIDLIFDDYSKDKVIDRIEMTNKPNKSAVRKLTYDLLQIVFPGYFRNKGYKIYNPKNLFATQIEDIFYHLNKQVYLGLNYCRLRDTMTEETRQEESRRICREFFLKLPKIREYVETDILAAYDGDPAAECYEEIILAYPGLMASTVNRLAHELYLLNVPVVPRLMTEYAHSETGIDIHPGATIGKYFFMDHGTGIVIGSTTVIGNHVKIYQGVTLGALSTSGGQKLSGVKRHPTIEDNVVIYSGVSVLGGETVIGKNAVIGGNAFIVSSIPANTRVSIKNQELEYIEGKNKHKKEDIVRSEEWYYII